MILFGKKKTYRFRGTDKKVLSDEAHSEDYRNSEHIGRVCLGSLCFYYRDLGVRYWVPYDYIQRAFIRISECPEDEFGNNQHYFRLILVHDGKEFANLIFNEEKPVETVLQRLALSYPHIAIGTENKRK